MKPLRLRPSVKLQLQALLGMLIVAVPVTLVLSVVPPFRDWPLWELLAAQILLMVVCMLWLRQWITPDGTSFKPKWW